MLGRVLPSISALVSTGFGLRPGTLGNYLSFVSLSFVLCKLGIIYRVLGALKHDPVKSPWHQAWLVACALCTWAGF